MDVREWCPSFFIYNEICKIAGPQCLCLGVVPGQTLLLT